MELWKRVTVGPDVFEALASEERISILKLLDQNKQMTGTDVANVLTISKSSAFKQLNRLARAGLVERMDEGRKWIYYRNTSKAERLLHPEDVTITLVLSAALAAVVVGLLLLLTLNPILGAGGTQSAVAGPNDSDVLVLSHPTLGSGGLVVQVYAGSARLSDISLFVASNFDHAVLATTAGSPSSMSPSLIGYGGGHASPAAITVSDLNHNGLLDAGDTIFVSGPIDASGSTLWVAANSGSTIASTGL